MWHAAPENARERGVSAARASRTTRSISSRTSRSTISGRWSIEPRLQQRAQGVADDLLRACDRRRRAAVRARRVVSSRHRLEPAKGRNRRLGRRRRRDFARWSGSDLPPGTGSLAGGAGSILAPARGAGAFGGSAPDGPAPGNFRTDPSASMTSVSSRISLLSLRTAARRMRRAVVLVDDPADRRDDFLHRRFRRRGLRGWRVRLGLIFATSGQPAKTKTLPNLGNGGPSFQRSRLSFASGQSADHSFRPPPKPAHLSFTCL